MSEARWSDVIADDFLESSAASFAAPLWQGGRARADQAGARIGPYLLIEELGHGGMGTVWLAERADGEYYQQVAIKLIKRGMDSDEIISQFRRERQILARLDHPNIARLQDGGVSDDGRPYLVMERIVGEPVTAYCDRCSMSAEQRLALFVVVCRAVQHAHQHLVVHRDIKPSNVLVTADGTVKLLDFGVARLLDADAALTTGSRALTPEYASPEQIRGDPSGTASDVYQLGLLLYEMLTGQRGWMDGSQRIPAERLPAPSQLLWKRADRGGGARGSIMRAVHAVRGDVDCIVLRAIRPDPADRYPSVAAMADDIEQRLMHRPIQARSENRSYRLGRFLRRNRWRLVAVSGLTVAALGVAGAYLTQVRQQRDVARLEADKANQSALMMHRMFDGWSPDNADRSKVSVGAILDAATVRAEHELGRQPATLAATLSLLGDLRGELGQFALADSLLVRALSIQTRLGNSAATDRAATLARRGHIMLAAGRINDAVTTLSDALTTYRSVEPPGGDDVLMVQMDLANSLRELGRMQQAETMLREAIRTAQPGTSLSIQLIGGLGYLLSGEARYDESAALLRQALAWDRQTLGDVNSSTVRTLRSLASALRGPAALPEAEALDREALANTRALFGESHPETQSMLLALAVLLERKGDFAGMASSAASAAQLAEQLYGGESLRTALALRTLGAAQLASGDLVSAEAVLRRAKGIFSQPALRTNPDFGDVLNRLAYLVVRRHAPDASTIYRMSVAFERDRVPGDPFYVTDGYEYLGWAAQRMKDTALANQMFQRAVTLYHSELPERHPYRVNAEAGLAGRWNDSIADRR